MSKKCLLYAGRIGVKKMRVLIKIKNYISEMKKEQTARRQIAKAIEIIRINNI